MNLPDDSQTKAWNYGLPSEVLSMLDGAGSASARQLLLLAETATPFVGWLLRRFASDCYAIEGKLDAAREAFPLPSLGVRASAQADSALSLDLHTRHTPHPRIILALLGPRVTTWGQDHLGELEARLSESIAGLEWGTLTTWATTAHRYPYFVFSGTDRSRGCASLSAFSFSLSNAVTRWVREVTRAAENALRSERGVPLVGEGWVSETQLFHAVRDALVGVTVVQHARPDWLRGQHLDVFIPDWHLAIEYQGAQHDRPVAFFGGEEGHAKTVQRDRRKRRACELAGVTLVEVRPETDFGEVLRILGEKRQATDSPLG